MPSWLFQIITVAVIPFIVNLLKKINVPTRIAPIVAVVLAIGIVAGGKALGVDLDLNSVLDIILKGLGLGAISIFGYDLYKTTILNK